MDMRTWLLHLLVAVAVRCYRWAAVLMRSGVLVKVDVIRSDGLVRTLVSEYQPPEAAWRDAVSLTPDEWLEFEKGAGDAYEKFAGQGEEPGEGVNAEIA